MDNSTATTSHVQSSSSVGCNVHVVIIPSMFFQTVNLLTLETPQNAPVVVHETMLQVNVQKSKHD